MTKVFQNHGINPDKLNHEFDITTYTNKAGSIVYVLSYSDSTVWVASLRGKVIGTCTDTGNGLKFSWKEKVELRNLNYGQANYILILLKYINKQQKIKSRTKFK